MTKEDKIENGDEEENSIMEKTFKNIFKSKKSSQIVLWKNLPMF